MDVDPWRPVLVGVGVADQSLEDPDDGDEAVELMVHAVRAAAEDAGAATVLAAVDQIAVPQGTWSYSDPARLIAQRIGATRARTVLAELGVPQQTLVNEAMRSILAGELDVALVVGGEAKRRAALAARAGLVELVTEQRTPPDERRRPTTELVAPAEIEAGVVVPVQQYALIENALRHAEGRTIDEHQAEIAALWESFNAVAQANPRAAFREPRDAAFLRTPGSRNRPLALPYNKWHATQWNVDQAAALLLCSARAARAYGTDPAQWVFPLVGLESSGAVSLSRRRELHRWPAMRTLGAAATAHLGCPVAELEHHELYSCFPSAVRVQQRELGLPLDRVPTVTGGMAFAGGPLNNYVLQATAAMAERLRDAPGERGLVTTVSGLLTKPGLAVWANEPGSKPPLVADLAADAARVSEAVESVPGYAGAATVATYTVTYDDLAPARVIVIADTPDGRRCVATTDDRELADDATTSELIGEPIAVEGPRFRR